MKRKVSVGMCLLLAVCLLFPFPRYLRDGGTVIYDAALYQVTDFHKLNPHYDSSSDSTPYIEGIVVTVLGIDVYSNLSSD